MIGLPVMFTVRTRLSALLGGGVALALCAVAPNTATAQSLTCGQVIVEDTTLKNDLSGCTGDGIVIGTDGITLDLNGHTVAGSCCTAIDGVDNTAGHDGVRILNGTIRGFEHGVALSGADENTLAGLTLVGGNPAVLLSASDHNAISRSSIDGGVSIRVGRSIALVDGSDENQVAQSRLGGEEGAAIFDSTGNRLVRNTVDGGSEGIALAGAQRTLIARNTLTSSGFGAITIVMFSDSDDNVIQDNDMPSNGMVIRGDRNRIERNDVQGRFPFLDESAIEILSGEANSVVSNRARGGADDIAVRFGALGTLIRGNVVVDALDDGIDVDAPGTVVRSNTANDNGDLGIEAVDGVIDGGGNRASGNANPLQCLNVVCR